jgi:hypothetical protein
MLLVSLAKCNPGRISQNNAKKHLVVEKFVQLYHVGQYVQAKG